MAVPVEIVLRNMVPFYTVKIDAHLHERRRRGQVRQHAAEPLRAAGSTGPDAPERDEAQQHATGPPTQ
jgi:hypothetical protein